MLGNDQLRRVRLQSSVRTDDRTTTQSRTIWENQLAHRWKLRLMMGNTNGVNIRQARATVKQLSLSNFRTNDQLTREDEV